MSSDKIIQAAIGAWESTKTHPSYSGAGAIGARSGIRDVMVRLGLYDKFIETKNKERSE